MKIGAWNRVLLTTAVCAAALLLASSDGMAGRTRRDNILHVARLFDPQTLDPALVQVIEDAQLLPLLFSALLDNTNTTELLPLSAKDWTMSEDARVYTVHLRPGLKFSNGREVVAEDFVYGIERVLNPANSSMGQSYITHIAGADDYIKGRTNHVSGLRTPDPSTVQVQLERADPTFAFLLTAAGVGCPIPREEVERGKGFATRPVGNGPYRVKSWVRGVRLELERNPHYAGPIPGYLDGIDIMIGGDEFTHLLMFEKNELDIAHIGPFFPFADLRRIKADRRWKGLLEEVPLLGTYGLIINCEIPPFTNVLVRRAMNYAIDRDRRMRVGGGVTAHCEGIIPPLVRGFDPNVRGFEYNPEKARALLNQSGVPLPIRSELWHATEEIFRMSAQGAQADLRRVGIEVELKVITLSQLFVAAQTRGKVPLNISGWIVTIPDPSDMLGAPFSSRTIPDTNMSYYDSPEVTKLLEEGAGTVNMTRRYEIYRQAERRILEDAPWVFLSHYKVNGLRQPWLKGGMIEPLYGFRLDRVWIDQELANRN